MDGGEETGAEGVDVAGAPGLVGAHLFDGDGGATAVAGEEERAFVGVGLAEGGEALGVVEGEGSAVFGQIAEAGVCTASEDDVAEVGHPGNGVEKDGLARAALAAGPEVADDVEGGEEPGGEGVAGEHLGHGALICEGTIKVYKAADDVGDAVEEGDRVGDGDWVGDGDRVGGGDGGKPATGTVGVDAADGPGAGGVRHLGEGDVKPQVG